MENILVTGGAGFIGSHLVPSLCREGYRVRVLDSLSPQIHGALPEALDWLDSESIEFIRGSVTDRSDVMRALRGMDQVVHLAAETGTGQSMYEISRYDHVNSNGTAMLFDVLANNQHSVRRVILASSRSVYGEGTYRCPSCHLSRICPGTRHSGDLASNRWNPVCPRCDSELQAIATREDDPVRPASIYAATKYAQEQLVRVGSESLNIGYAILRLQNVYGEGQSLKNPYTGILSIFSTRIRRSLELPIFEDGNETRDFVHAADVSGAILACIQTTEAPNAVINVGSGKATSVLLIAKELARALGREVPIRVTGEYRIGDIRHNMADITLLREKLSYVPKVALTEGLRRFASWVETQPLPPDRLGEANDELRVRNLMS